MIPKRLEKNFKGAIKSAKDNKILKQPETKEDKIQKIMKQLGIEKHGKGKRKKKGGKRK